jgi:DNA-binding LytR/AlgR family response regulator
MVLFVEGLENYVKIHCESRMITSLNTMKFIESAFPHEHFLRIHRSYIVNMNKVESIRDGCFCDPQQDLMIGRSYKKTVQSLLRNNYAVKLI